MTATIDRVVYTLRTDGLYAQPEHTTAEDAVRVCAEPLAMEVLDAFYRGDDSLVLYLLRTDQPIPAWLAEQTIQAAEAR